MMKGLLWFMGYFEGTGGVKNCYTKGKKQQRVRACQIYHSYETNESTFDKRKDGS